MTRFRLLIAAAVALIPFAGCNWLRDVYPIKPKPGGDPLPEMPAINFVNYLNVQAKQMQSLTTSVRIGASKGNFRLPATLTGNLAASQPRNFRLRADALAAKVDLGSNSDQFWVFFDGAGAKQPVFVYASHSDFESGKAQIPGGIPFEPDWVMQGLGLTAPPMEGNQYTVKVDQTNRTYTLSWPTTTPNKVPVVKEIVFDADPATGNKPQVKRHLVRDTKAKVIASAEIKEAKTVPELRVQYPTRIVLKWELERFELDLELSGGKVNDPIADEAARRLFTRPGNTGVEALNLAEYRLQAR